MKLFTLILTFIVTFLCIDTVNSYAQLQGQVPLNPRAIPQFVDPLPHFAGHRIPASDNMVIRYEPTRQVAVSKGTVLQGGIVGAPGTSPDLGKANLWAYSVSNDGGNTFTGPHWPAFTIEAQRNSPVKVKYENNLIDKATGDFLTYANVYLIADQTLHWADPLMEGLMANPPIMMNMATYTGPVPVVPHLHGGEVASESDGGPDAWFTPGYAQKGPSWGIGETDENYYYPNTQEAATLWWHDHALGATRLNVYAGLAGFYFLKGDDEENAHLPGWSGDDLVQEVAINANSGTFNPEPYLPEIEIVFQDRMFDTNGQLYFPNLPPNFMEHPFWTPEFIGDIITVNGKTWPYLSVAQRKYRFRLLNGSNARFYEIQLKDLVTGLTGPAIVQIGTDGGLLDSPVTITGKLLLAPGERADVVIDFTTSLPGQKWTVVNSGRAPFPKGGPPNGATVGRLMQFVVNGTKVDGPDADDIAGDPSAVPATLRSNLLIKLTNFAGAPAAGVTPQLTRQLTLNEVMGMGGPLEVLVNNTKWDGNGMSTSGLGETELPVEGTTEVWQIINTTADAHPIHLHLVQFQLVSRQAFNTNNYMKAYNAAFPGGLYIPSVGPPKPYNTKNADQALGGNPAITPFLQGKVKAANLNERGWKDTYIVYPGEVTTFIIRFAPTTLPITTPQADLFFPDFDPGLGPGYVWHCHIIDHEDNEMMRPYKVSSNPLRPVQLLASKGTSLLTGKALKGSTSVVASEQLSENINGVVLEQNYPNPFSGETEIRFSLPEAAHVRMTLFNSIGNQVNIILDADAPAGLNTVKLDAGKLKAGIYFYQLKTGTFSQVRRMVVQN